MSNLCAISALVSWVAIWINFQFQMVNLALNDVYYATLAVGRGDTAYAHKLSRRSVRLRRFGYPLLWFLPHAKRLFW